MMPAKTTIGNIVKRSNSCCDGTRYEGGSRQYSKGERIIHDCFSTDAIDVAKYKYAPELDGPVGWCGGDFRDEGNAAANDRTQLENTFRDVSEEVRYKDTVIDELQKSNHELRIKFADAENKIAQLRLKIQAHCECCQKGLGVEDFAERKGYNDWSTVYSLGMENIHQLNPQFWNSRDYNGMASDASPYLSRPPDDILNPYIKVKKWQDSMDPRNVKETDSSTGSTYALRSSRPLSPNNVSGRSAPRAKSPCVVLPNDYVLLPLASRATPPGEIHTFGMNDDVTRQNKNYFYQRKSFELGGNVKVDTSEDTTPRRFLKETAKSAPEEWILRSGKDHRLSDSSLSTTHNSNDCCRINAGLIHKQEQLLMNQYNHAIMQSMHKSWMYHEHNPRFKRSDQQSEITTGIVGGLMKASLDHEKQRPI